MGIVGPNKKIKKTQSDQQLASNQSGTFPMLLNLMGLWLTSNAAHATPKFCRPC